MLNYSLLCSCNRQLKKFLFLVTAIINTAYVAELSRALDIRLINWCCNVSMVRVQFQSMERKKLSAQKCNSNTCWVKFSDIYK